MYFAVFDVLDELGQIIAHDCICRWDRTIVGFFHSSYELFVFFSGKEKAMAFLVPELLNRLDCRADGLGEVAAVLGGAVDLEQRQRIKCVIV